MTLKDRRAAKGFSQGDLSKASNISVRSIQHYEHGNRDINGAHLKTLCALADALDCKIIDLLTDEELKKQYKKVK